MHILAVEPDFYTRYPPLGLLKLAAYHRSEGDSIELVRSPAKPLKEPDRVYVTSLFTYAWRPVHEAIAHYKALFPKADVWLGGIYASLLPEHASLSGANKIFTGLFKEAEDVLPAYDLVPEWKASIIFASRGCIRHCSFCSVPKMEGKPSNLRYGIRDLIYPGHAKVILWDNNILGNPNWKAILEELAELQIEADFNQGLDGRLVTEEVAEKVASCRMRTVRLAYDRVSDGSAIEKAIQRLCACGIPVKKIVVYALFNYKDDPEELFRRVRDILNWGAACYPMRFEPLTTLEKNSYVGAKWTADKLDQVARARRVLGYAGAFPSYEGLIQKFNRADDFDDAFSLRPMKKDQSVKLKCISAEPLRENLVSLSYHGSRRLRKANDWRQALTKTTPSYGRSTSI